MKHVREYVVSALLGGFVLVVPLYLALLLLLKAMQSVVGLVRPLATLFPAGLPAENGLALLLVVTVCFLVGAAVRTATGRTIRERVERSLFERVPGYALFRSLTQRLAGESRESAWRPALVEADDLGSGEGDRGAPSREERSDLGTIPWSRWEVPLRPAVAHSTRSERDGGGACGGRGSSPLPTDCPHPAGSDTPAALAAARRLQAPLCGPAACMKSCCFPAGCH
jgi:hypothetical protein